MQKLISLFLLLSFPNHALSQEKWQNVYLVPDFKNIAIAENSLELIQCLIEQSSLFVEIVDKEDPRTPQIELKETSRGVQVFWKEKKKENLGTFPLHSFHKRLCEKIRGKQFQKPLPIVIKTKGKTLQPWLVALGIGITLLFFSKKTNQKRGFIPKRI